MGGATEDAPDAARLQRAAAILVAERT